MVEVTHRKGSVHQKISGITALPTSQLKFFVDDKGASETVVQYFKKKYRVALRFTHFPCLEAGTDSSPSYLPMEVCRIVEGQRYSKNLNENHVTGLLRAACRPPLEREAIINMTMKEKNLDEYEDAQKVGISVTDELITIKSARVLPPPMLKYHDSGLEVKVQPHDGQWNMKNSKMFTGAKLEYWACLNFSSLDTNEVTLFCNKLVAMCNSKGMVVEGNPIATYRSAKSTEIRSAIKAIRREAIANTRGRFMQLLIIILPDPDPTGPITYEKIKRTCETELDIVSQCCKPENVKKLHKQFLENVALKINVKVGGRNTVLDAAVEKTIPFLSDLPTIVFGADVSHPSPGDDSSPSIAAVVASIDWPLVSKYRCVVSAQQHRQELINDLATVVEDPQKGLICKGTIRELIVAHTRLSGHKPCRIIFYRDGVSEGQFPQVLRHEVNAIRQVITSQFVVKLKNAEI